MLLTDEEIRSQAKKYTGESYWDKSIHFFDGSVYARNLYEEEFKGWKDAVNRIESYNREITEVNQRQEERITELIKIAQAHCDYPDTESIIELRQALKRLEK